jgi:flagellar basal-body rod protein FlgG
MRALHTAATGMMAQELNVRSSRTTSPTCAPPASSASASISRICSTSTFAAPARRPRTRTRRCRPAPSSAPASRPPRPARDEPGQPDADREALRRRHPRRRLLPHQMPDGRTAYSRDGSFELDARARFVTVDGYVVEPGITVPNNATSRLDQRGRAPCEASLPEPDRAAAASGRSSSPASSTRSASNRSATTCSSRRPLPARRSTTSAATEGFGTLQQNYLEEGERPGGDGALFDLIAAQRAYEMNSKVISAADQMMQSTSQMMR